MREGRGGIALPGLEDLLREGVISGLTDRELLERFVSDRDRSGEPAFTALVARHGPMVLGVCRRILRDSAEADDAFQATFLVLARKADSIRLGSSLGPWLHGVSRRVARRLNAVAARGRPGASDDEWLRNLPDRRTAGAVDVDRRLEIDESLASLPDSFRAAIRLCYLEGLSHEEAAARLDCPVGTVRSRLARGRAILRRCLEGPAPSRPGDGRRDRPVDRAPAPVVPALLIHSTARAAAMLAAGRPMAGAVPARVLVVAMGVAGTMSRSKTIAATLLLMASTGLIGLGAWASQPGAPPESKGSPRVVRIGQRSNAEPAKTRPTLPEDFPAFVVETVPKLGDPDVDPATTKEIRITFSKPMLDQSWSLTQGNVYAFPETTGKPHYLADRRTCVFPVKLEPGKTYVMGINGGRFNNFKDASGKSSLPSSLAFRTRGEK